MNKNDDLMSIGDAAKILGVTIGTLRQWQREGKIDPPLKTPGNHRRYTFTYLKKIMGENLLTRSIDYPKIEMSDIPDELFDPKTDGLIRLNKEDKTSILSRYNNAIKNWGDKALFNTIISFYPYFYKQFYNSEEGEKS